jgi:hypothetical protein
MATYGQELLVETLGHMLGAITIVCGALCTTPPTSIVGVILWIGYFGEAVLLHLRIGLLPISFISLGLCLALMVGSRWGCVIKVRALRCRARGNPSQVSLFL